MEFITGSVCPSDNPVFGSAGSGVHADRKYSFNWSFLQNTPFYRFLTLQFSGLRAVTLFNTSLMSWEVRKSRKPAGARQIDHVGELRGYGCCSVFLVFARFCFCGYVGVRIEEEIIVNTIHTTRPVTRDFTGDFKNIFLEIFLPQKKLFEPGFDGFFYRYVGLSSNHTLLNYVARSIFP